MQTKIRVCIYFGVFRMFFFRFSTFLIGFRLESISASSITWRVVEISIILCYKICTVKCCVWNFIHSCKIIAVILFFQFTNKYINSNKIFVRYHVYDVLYYKRQIQLCTTEMSLWVCLFNEMRIWFFTNCMYIILIQYITQNIVLNFQFFLRLHSDFLHKKETEINFPLGT